MKPLKILSLVLIIAIASVMLVGCSQDEISTPDNLRINNTTGILSWDRVKDAKDYIVDTGVSKYLTTDTSFALDRLEVGTYDIVVTARDEKKRLSTASDPIKYARTEAALLNLKGIDGNTAYEVIGLARGAGNNIVIPSSYNGLPIKSIGKGAFESYANLTSIVIGDNVEVIGDSAFKNCTDLSSVTFGERVKSIGAYAFQGCLAIKDITMPSSVTSIEAYSFSYAKALEKVVLSDNITSIPNNAFADASKLTDIVLPSSISSIGDFAFANNRSLVSINIPGGVRYIGESAFYGDKALKSIEIPSSVESIGKFAFMDATALESVRLNEGLKSIGVQAFYEDSMLSTVNIPLSVKSIGEYAFDKTKIYDDSSDSVYVDNWLVSTKAVEGDTFIMREGTRGMANLAIHEISNVKKAVLSQALEYIGSYNFYKMDNMSMLDFGGANIKSIDRYAFFGAKGLRVDTLPDSLRHIGENAFGETMNWSLSSGYVMVGDWLVGHKDKKVNGLNFPDGVRGVSDYAFARYGNVADVTLNEGLEYIGEGAFANMKHLIEIKIPDTVMSIGEYAFANNISLGKVIMPKGLRNIEKSTFYNDGKLKDITFPTALESIGDYAFYGAGLTTLTLPDSLRTVGYGAFYANNVLSSIDLGKGLREIGDFAFAKAINLESIVMSDSVKVIGDRAFYGDIILKSVTLGGGVESVGDYAFYNLPALERVTMGNNVKSIGKYAFAKNSHLTSVKMSNSLRDIGKGAFAECINLEYIYLPSSVEYIGDYAFTADDKLSIYAGGDDEKYAPMWNSSYRPVIFGVNMSEEGYLVSFVKSEDSVHNMYAYNGLTPPMREGYKCIGWSTKEGGEVTISLDNIRDVIDGTTLYSVWVEEIK